MGLGTIRMGDGAWGKWVVGGQSGCEDGDGRLKPPVREF